MHFCTVCTHDLTETYWQVATAVQLSTFLSRRMRIHATPHLIEVIKVVLLGWLTPTIQLSAAKCTSPTQFLQYTLHRPLLTGICHNLHTQLKRLHYILLQENSCKPQLVYARRKARAEYYYSESTNMQCPRFYNGISTVTANAS